jgi:hypothetical protein
MSMGRWTTTSTVSDMSMGGEKTGDDEHSCGHDRSFNPILISEWSGDRVGAWRAICDLQPCSGSILAHRSNMWTTEKQLKHRPIKSIGTKHAPWHFKLGDDGITWRWKRPWWIHEDPYKGGQWWPAAEVHTRGSLTLRLTWAAGARCTLQMAGFGAGVMTSGLVATADRVRYGRCVGRRSRWWRGHRTGYYWATVHGYIFTYSIYLYFYDPLKVINFNFLNIQV